MYIISRVLKCGFSPILNRSQNIYLFTDNIPTISLLNRHQYSTTNEASKESISTSNGNSSSHIEDKTKDGLDRTRVIPLETSIKYLKSEAYKEAYGNSLVWQLYRRNHKGMFPPKKTRRTCIRQGKIACGNPCPICRDEYLVIDHRNVDLLKQFISPQTGEVLKYSKTGLCQKRHFELLVAVERAFDYGFLTFSVPHREYDYSEYYPSIPKK